jgi:hypothetical protein
MPIDRSDNQLFSMSCSIDVDLTRVKGLNCCLAGAILGNNSHFDKTIKCLLQEDKEFVGKIRHLPKK